MPAPPTPSNRDLDALGKRASKAELRLAFEASVKAGAPIKATAERLGIPISTARHWRMLQRRGDAAEVARTSALLSRGDLAEKLQTVIERATEHDEVIKAVMSYARLMGLEAPTRSEVMVRSVPASVVSWLHARIDTGQAGDSDTLLEAATPTKQITSDC